MTHVTQKHTYTHERTHRYDTDTETERYRDTLMLRQRRLYGLIVSRIDRDGAESATPSLQHAEPPDSPKSSIPNLQCPILHPDCTFHAVGPGERMGRLGIDF